MLFSRLNISVTVSVVSLVFVGCTLKSTKFNTEKTSENVPPEYYCESDEECVLTSVCGCGCPEVVNRLYKDQKECLEEMEPVGCSVYCFESRPVCKENTCTLEIIK